jgi:hypothetical protein
MTRDEFLAHNGEIAIDSEPGKFIGFTSDRFKGGSLWKRPMEPCIVWPVQENRKDLPSGRPYVWHTNQIEPVRLRYVWELMEAIRLAGRALKVPTACGYMRKFVRLRGWRQEYDRNWRWFGGQFVYVYGADW